jgi:membrane-bound ClpP family serine protease
MDTMLVWGLGLLGLSVIFLIGEAFLPSAGILGVSAVVAAIAGVVCLFRYDTTWGLSGTLGLVVLGPIAVYGLLKLWPHTPIGRRVIGAPTEEELERVHQEEASQRAARAALIGLEGQTLTDLRPVGLASIRGERMEVLSETGFVPTGTRVRVTHADLRLIKVRPAN